MEQEKKNFARGLAQAWRDEKRSALNYRALAGREKDEKKREILVRMAEAEERHAERWAERLRELGQSPAPYKESWLERMQRRVLLQSDSTSAARMLEAGENDADGLYDRLMVDADQPEDRSALKEAMLEERAHSKMLGEFQTDHPRGRLDSILGKEKWHVRGGGWIGQAIYGVNDGLGAAFGVVSGVAGATNANGEFVLLSGAAAMIASALSMGSGAYLATKSEREVYQAELDREQKEIDAHPEEEREELELFYQLKGLSPEEAHTMVARVAADPAQMLRSLAHEELGLSAETFPNEWRAAVSATLSTAVGAAIPVLPFIFATGMTALIESLILSTIAHFAVGASKVLVTGRSWVKSGMEMTLVGLGEATVTYLIGVLLSPMFT
jgi:vacuolar iron transporter family protein